MKNQYEFIDKNTMEVKTNSLGYQQLITTLTAVGRKVAVQKFFEIPFAEYVPVVMGNGAFMRAIINWRTFIKGEGFESGIISTSGNNAQLHLVDAAYDQVSQNILNWGKALEYNIFELEEAMRANTIFSLIEARETARRKEWDLGIQKVAFLGIQSELGLLNQTGCTTDATNLTGWIKELSAENFNLFVGKIYELYRANCARTAKPTHFIMPEGDFNGLVNYASTTMFTKTKLELLLEAFKTITGNSNFKILPCAYGDKANYDGVYNRYALLNYDETSIKMDLPMDYVMTQAGTVNGFTWQNVGYGQFTGVALIRPKELYYFTHTA